MRHQKTNKKLGRKKEPRELMLRNLASSVLLYEKVRTTKVKAKVVRSLVEKIITTAKKGDLTARRKLIALLPQKNAVKKAMDILGKRYQHKNGGYVRITSIQNRQGDGAEMAQIELIDNALSYDE